MFEKEIEELNKAIKHLENDILPSKCNGNISCYNEHLQLYRWIKELKSYKEIQAKNNEDIFKDYAEKWWQNEYSPHTYTNKPTTSIFCPTCNIPMLLCQYYGGSFYWTCGQCGCKVERTGY